MSKMTRAEYEKKYVYRIKWEAQYGKIPAGFHVHHIDRNHKNNHMDNLVALPEWYHVQIHRDMQLEPGSESKYTRDFLIGKYHTFVGIYEDHAMKMAALNIALQEQLDSHRREGVTTGRSKRKKNDSRNFKKVPRIVIKESSLILKPIELSPEARSEFDRIYADCTALSQTLTNP